MTAAPSAVPATIAGAVQWDVTAAANGLAYRIFLGLPVAPPPKDGYPALFVTDANAWFATAHWAALQGAFGELSPGLVVGIGYPTADPMVPVVRRFLDLSPPGEMPPMMRAVPLYKDAQVGGADAFARFLLHEARPAIEARYPVDGRACALYGDSLGGLFVLHLLFAQPEAFAAWIAASPSIGWNDRSVLAGEAQLRRRIADGEVAPRLLVTVGEFEQTAQAGDPPAGMSREQYEKIVASMAMVDNARDLVERLKRADAAGACEFRFDLFPGETHGSVVPASISRAVSFAFRRG